MGGIMKNGQAYATTASIDDTVISGSKTWSSEKISKINVSDAKKVDAKPTYADGTITYLKDGASYNTTNAKQWFYYLDNGSLKQTIFIDGEELTIDGAGADFDEYVKKTSITDSVDSQSTNNQVPGAKFIYDNTIKNKNLKTYTSLSQLGLESGCKTYDIFSALPDNSYLEIGCNESKSGNLVNVSDIPAVYGLLTIRKWDKTRFSIELKMSGGGTLAPNVLYIGQLKGNDGSNLTWKRVCTTTIDDVPTTKLKLIDSESSGNVYYKVLNGTCYVWGSQFSRASGTGDVTNVYLCEGLPNCGDITPGSTIRHYSESKGNVWMAANETKLKIATQEATGSWCLFDFSYPVAEI